MAKTYDFIVIGSGPGGAITALTLAEANKEVLVLEEGPAFELNESSAFGLADLRDKYRNSGQTFALGRPKISFVEGALFGGGSEVNAGLYHRTPAPVLQEWRDLFDVKECGEENLLPHFEYIENLLGVRLDEKPPASSLVLAEAAKAKGWASIQAQQWIHSGIRQSMSLSVWPKAIKQGVEILLRQKVVQIQKTKDHWQILTSSGALHSSKNIYVCGGAIETPRLLRRSGVKGLVGHSLQMHPTFRFVARFNKAVNQESLAIPSHQIRQFAPDLSMGGSISTRSHLAVGLCETPENLIRLREEWRNFAIYYVMVRPEARGRVIDIPFFKSAQTLFNMTNRDLEKLSFGAGKLSELLFSAGAVSLHASIAGGLSLNSASDAALMTAKLIRNKGRLITIHLFSSCPMGENKSRCVTNSFGKVHGQQGLYINDASLLCSAPGVNPQGTIMAFARRNTLCNIAENHG